MDKIHFRTDTASTGRGKLGYAVFGNGVKQLIILPGVSLKSILFSAGSVAKAFEAFADEYTVWLFDRADGMTDGYTIRDMAEDAAGAMRSLGIAGAYLYGASQGGMIAMCLAALYPELVKKAVLASTAAAPPESAQELFRQWIRLAERADNAALNEAMFAYIYSPQYLAPYEKYLPVLYNEGTKDDCRRMAVMLKACVGLDLTPLLSLIACPVLIIAGEQDRIFGSSPSRAMAEHIRGSRLFVYPDGSHACYDEEADFREKMLDFFEA